MRYTIYLKDKRNGNIKKYNDDWDYKDDDDYDAIDRMLINWFEGNYSCDCNKSIFMYGEKGELSCNGKIETIIVEKIIERESKKIIFDKKIHKDWLEINKK